MELNFSSTHPTLWVNIHRKLAWIHSLSLKPPFLTLFYLFFAPVHYPSCHIPALTHLAVFLVQINAPFLGFTHLSTFDGRTALSLNV